MQNTVVWIKHMCGPQRQKGLGSSLAGLLTWVAGLLAGLLTVLYVAVIHYHGNTSRTPAPTSLLQQTLDAPHPYEYDTFMQWLKTHDFSKATGLKWAPEVAEFDLDGAANGKKFGPYLHDALGTTVLKKLKDINKFLFLEEIMVSGDLGEIGSPATHLYIMHQLAPAAKDSKHPTFIDAGCGPGYLLMAWAMMAGADSRAIGFDMDADVIAAAHRHMEQVDRARNIPANIAWHASIGDAFKPDSSKLGVSAGTVDAANVGVGMPNADALSPYADLLRTGGRLTAPICLSPEEQSAETPSGKCDALFETFVKSSNGMLQRVENDPDIHVRFVAPLFKSMRGGR